MGLFQRAFVTYPWLQFKYAEWSRPYHAMPPGARNSPWRTIPYHFSIIFAYKTANLIISSPRLFYFSPFDVTIFSTLNMPVHSFSWHLFHNVPAFCLWRYCALAFIYFPAMRWGNWWLWYEIFAFLFLASGLFWFYLALGQFYIWLLPPIFLSLWPSGH